MLKISVLLWILLTIIIIILPVGIISFFFSKSIYKKLAHLLNKIDTFDALITIKKNIIHIYRNSFSRISKHIHKEKVSYVKHEEEHVVSDSIDEIIKPKHSVSKYPDSDPVAVVDNEENKTILMKKRKLLEKIIYDALWFRKDGKFEEYEKKIIEWLAIDQEDKDLNKL